MFLAYQNRHDAARHRVVEQAVWLARWFASGRDLFPEHELNNLKLSCIIACQVAYSLVIGAYSTAEPGKSRRTTFRRELSRSPSFGVLAVPAFTHQLVAFVLRYRARSGAWCRVPGEFRFLGRFRGAGNKNSRWSGGSLSSRFPVLHPLSGNDESEAGMA